MHALFLITFYNDTQRKCLKCSRLLWHVSEASLHLEFPIHKLILLRVPINKSNNNNLKMKHFQAYAYMEFFWHKELDTKFGPSIFYVLIPCSSIEGVYKKIFV